MATSHFEASKLFSVKDWVCVVTGGGTGIGLMATQALAANGAKVYIIGRRVEALENAATAHNPSFTTGGQIIPLGPCDVRSKAELENIVHQLRTTHGETRINLLMCNAGISGDKAEPEAENAEDLQKTLWDKETVEAWGETFNTDCTSVYFTTVAFLPLLQASIQPNGPLERFVPSVITTSSMSGMIRHAQGHFSYNAAKAATVHLTRMMSAEFQQTGIRVNSIAPGYFPSEMTAKTSDDRQKSHVPQEEIAEKGHVPAMRAGRDQEMGMTVLFLAKNAYVNGQIVAVDGGVLNVIAS